MTQQKHQLVRVAGYHRCLLCGKLFYNYTEDEAHQIDEVCSTLRRSTVTGTIRIDKTAMDEMVARLFGGVLSSSPLSNPQSDSAQRKGDTLAMRIEEEWRND